MPRWISWVFEATFVGKIILPPFEGFLGTPGSHKTITQVLASDWHCGGLHSTTMKRGGRVVKSVAFKPGVSQRRSESSRRQTVTVTACILWQGSFNLSATSRWRLRTPKRTLNTTFIWFDLLTIEWNQVDYLCNSCADQNVSDWLAVMKLEWYFA